VDAGPVAGPSLRLEVIRGNAAGSTIEVHDELAIGRESSTEGRLGDDPELSRRHARVRRGADGAFELEDVGSTNGTFLNGRRLDGPHPLSTGDTIGVGETIIVATVVGPVAEVEPTPEHGSGSQATVFAPSTPLPTPPGDPAPAGQVAVAAPAPGETRPALSVRLEVDWDARVVSVAVGDDAEPIRLAQESGRWRVRSEPGAK
jgi:pSer/pThr/pTyr-binding forkhead associated (FHA) protein